MKHKDLWTTISVAFLTEPEERTEKQKLLARGGLCWALDDLDAFMFSFVLTNAFYNKGSLSGAGLFWLPVRELSGAIYGHHTRQHDKIRGDFAQLMACMDEDEFNELTS